MVTGCNLGRFPAGSECEGQATKEGREMDEGNYGKNHAVIFLFLFISLFWVFIYLFLHSFIELYAEQDTES
jgi:hypothetical protein